jgi:hypothetical protein
MPDARRDEFVAAYQIWRAARTEYDSKMQRIMDGEPAEMEQLIAECKELDRLHSDWMAKSKPFVHWR